MTGNDALTEKDQKELQVILDDMMYREMQAMYVGLVERCFSKCVTSFRSRKILSSEKVCARAARVLSLQLPSPSP